MNGKFYKDFEDRFRGSRDEITHRLEVYKQFVNPLLIAYPDAHAIDLGCGRGEWVEILVRAGFVPTGIDNNAEMLDACRNLKLPVKHGDLLSSLQELSDESQALVSAFHVVEHITFDQLQTLVAETFRVLKPGGLLIMETPNPENIVVATNNFYLDPTHTRPIPSMLLAYIAEHAGFARIKTLRLQESKEIIDKFHVRLRDVIGGVSPDYSIVAQKNAPQKIMDLTCTPFSLNYGLSLEDLLQIYDNQFGPSLTGMVKRIIKYIPKLLPFKLSAGKRSKDYQRGRNGL